MDVFVRTVTDPAFLVAMLAAISAAAVVFTFGASFVATGPDVKARIKRVALERERLRAEEMARLRGDGDTRASVRRQGGSEYVKTVVDRFSLRKLLADENTVEALARAGYRGPGPLTTFVFLRFVTPFALFIVGFTYLSLVLFADRPLWMNALYALFMGLIGAYLPSLMLKNRTIKRQKSIRRAWPDCLDLMLLCVESGMSVEMAF